MSRVHVITTGSQICWDSDTTSPRVYRGFGNCSRCSVDQSLGTGKKQNSVTPFTLPATIVREPSRHCVQSCIFYLFLTHSPHLVASSYGPASFLRANPDGLCARRIVLPQSNSKVIGTWPKASQLLLLSETECALFEVVGSPVGSRFRTA